MFGSGGGGALIAGTANRYENNSNAWFQFATGGLIPLNSDGTFEYSGELLTTAYSSGDAPYSSAITSASDGTSNITKITTWNIPMDEVTTMAHFANNSPLYSVDFSQVSGENITNWNYAFSGTPIEGELDLSMFKNNHLGQTSFNNTFQGCQAMTIRTPLDVGPKTVSDFVSNCPNLERLYLGSENVWTNSWESSGFEDNDLASEFHDCPKLVEIYLGKMNIDTNPSKLLLCANYLYWDFILDTEAIDSTYEIKKIRRHEMISALTQYNTQSSISTNIKYHTGFSTIENLNLPRKNGGNKFRDPYEYDAYKETNSERTLIKAKDEADPYYNTGASSFKDAFIGNSDIRMVKCSLNLCNCGNFIMAFANCPNLTQVHFYNPDWYAPHAVNAAYNEDGDCSSMFKNSYTLRKVTMFAMQNIKYASRMFYGCSNLEKVIIPHARCKNWDHTFSGCTKLTNLKFVDYYGNGDRTTDDTDWAHNATSLIGTFEGCSSLTEITLNPYKDNVVDISSCFSGCSSLKTITFEYSPNLNESSTNVFNGCTSLKRINIPSSNTTAHRMLIQFLTNSGLTCHDHYGYISVND